jgi:hypothetical protein
MSMFTRRVRLAFLTSWLVAMATSASAAPVARWSDGYSLVVLESGADLRRATRLVQAAGGTVALELPPRCLAGWIPPRADAALVGHAGIRSIHRGSAALPADLMADRAMRHAARFFVRAARGELEFAAAEAGARTDAARGDFVPGAGFEPGPGVLLPDAFTRPPISELDIAANLRARGVAAPHKAGAGASLAANSETMTGTIAVGLVFVESDGTGSDPNTHDWTAAGEDDVYDNAAAALSWWSSRADDHGDCWAVFRLEPYFATQDARCRQWREPTLHPSTEFANAVSAVLGNLGYTAGGHLARAAAFDAALRTQLDTDWAFSAFVAANPTGPTQFTDGYAAWAYLGGPYCAFLQRSFGWSSKQVFAHETAHAFRACDEYSVAGYGGCSSCSGCADTGVDNGNCEACNPNPATCMMRTNAFALCDYTVAQLGWGRSPCVPQALPAPQIDTASPAVAAQGEVLDVELQGDLFALGSSADFGTGIDVVAVDLVSATRLRARVRVDVEAIPGARDVRVVGPDGQSDALPAGFAVRSTPCHYVAAFGGNVFPFDRPDRAAPDLATVVAACSAGDTLLVQGGTYGPIVISKTLIVRGSFTAHFDTRRLDTEPTIVQGTPGAPAIGLDGSANRTVLDGVVVRGGTGTRLWVPGLGSVLAGGGVLSQFASPTLRDCRLEDNAAGQAAAGGAGGGGFFWGGQPVLERCTARRNAADRGGGLLFFESDVRLAHVVIEDNDAYYDGGGVFASATALRCESSRIVGNEAGREGGGVWSAGGTLALEATLLAMNQTAGGGAGVHANGTGGHVLNVTAADNRGGSGILILEAPAPIPVRGSIFVRNGLGGFLTGGGAAPVLEWNLTWQNDVADWLGTDGGAHVVVADPRFTDVAAADYRLGLGSPALDGGDPASERADRDGSRNDCGAYGGPLAAPAAPAWVAQVQARLQPAGPRVQWTPSPVPGIATYAVYRDAGPPFDIAGLEPIAQVPATQFELVDTGGTTSDIYAVVAVDAAGHASAPRVAGAVVQPTDAGGPGAVLALHPIAPNPVNPGAWVEFELPDARRLQLAVYAANGRRIRVLAAAAFAAGRHRAYWDGHDDAGRACASGVYWVHLDAGSERRTRRCVVVR